VIGNGDGGGKEKARSSGGRSFQTPETYSADMGRLENMRPGVEIR